jgi:hypothetical protein
MVINFVRMARLDFTTLMSVICEGTDKSGLLDQ